MGVGWLSNINLSYFLLSLDMIVMIVSAAVAERQRKRRDGNVRGRWPLAISLIPCKLTPTYRNVLVPGIMPRNVPTTKSYRLHELTDKI